MQTLVTSHNPDEAYRKRFGAPFVDLSFRVADWYLLARERQAARHLARLLGASWQKKVEISSCSRGQPS
jgi:hypothetical protein